PNPCRIPASVFDGAPKIKGNIKIKSDSLRIVVTTVTVATMVATVLCRRLYSSPASRRLQGKVTP
ncbi:hypothetical protein, partial [Pseudomonas pergaminensis]